MEWKPIPQADPKFVGEVGRWPVTKNLAANLRLRMRVLKEADGSASTQAALLDRCKRDPLFWLNVFCFTKDPRIENKTPPFITYPFQDDALKLMVAKVRGQEDCLIEKSRDMGASWMLISVFTWFWMFYDHHDFLLISRNESLVDKKGNPKSLFWKIRFLLKRLPPWMQPNCKPTHLEMVNFDTESTITGESTNKNAGRGDRQTAVGIDEAAAIDNLVAVMDSMPDTTECCFLNSTPRGEETEFFKIREARPDIVLSLHWPMHPIKSKGLYRLTPTGGTEILDKTHVFPADYPWPVMDDNLLGATLRSPWYDKKCIRMGNARRIAQELDIDHGASGGQAFLPKVIETLKALAKQPLHIGDVEYDNETGEMVGWMPSDLGSMRIWLPLDHNNQPFEDNFVASADVSAGTGASNSALSVVRRDTGEKVASFASSRIQPQHFGALAVAICRWFYGAKLIWDRGGVGRIFGQAVEDCGYMNVYVQRAEEHRHKKRTDIPGFHPTKKNKTALLLSYAAALQSGAFTNPDKIALEECLKFVRVGEDVTHSEEKTTNDPAGAGSNHGDRAFADALAWFICKRFKQKKKPVVKEKTLDMWTPGGRFQAAERDKMSQGQGMTWFCEKAQ